MDKGPKLAMPSECVFTSTISPTYKLSIVKLHKTVIFYQKLSPKLEKLSNIIKNMNEFNVKLSLIKNKRVKRQLVNMNTKCTV